MSSEKDDKPALDALPSGFRARTLTTARLASRLGMAALKATIGRGGNEAEDEADAVEKARALVTELGALKGLVMKFGQMASYLPGSMPPAAQKVLAELQADTRALSFSSVATVLQDELGDKPHKLFESFDEKPFAAASIGQVHRARFEGREVAVKIQYPGVEDALRSDLKTVGFMTSMSTVGTALDAKASVEELRARILEECDYRLEARRQRAFAGLFGADARCHVPAVIEARSARRVLTTELVTARPFARFVADGTQAEKDEAAAVIFGTCFHSIFARCVYNADPHPGNYLFHDDADARRVTFLDFGCVRRFSPSMIDNWKRFALSVRRGDKVAFRDNTIALGLAPPKGKFDWDHHWKMVAYLYTPFLAKTPFRYSQAYVSESYDLLIWKNPNRMRATMPPEWLFLNRLQWGLNSILAQLDATGPWGDLWWEAVESKTEPTDVDAP